MPQLSIRYNWRQLQKNRTIIYNTCKAFQPLQSKYHVITASYLAYVTCHICIRVSRNSTKSSINFVICKLGYQFRYSACILTREVICWQVFQALHAHVHTSAKLSCFSLTTSIYWREFLCVYSLKSWDIYLFKNLTTKQNDCSNFV